ncbi:MAG: glycoside hydrolase family 32 protein [Bacteroidales bacterium]|nr:glycoside hydrolase family 32 protein [Bacteroidales bacterium]MCF8336655.1 glycoside hydrolase family 32 protein [Bacteroidales bacterium]
MEKTLDLVNLKGSYHLFYKYLNTRNQQMRLGHSISDDLLNWDKTSDTSDLNLDKKGAHVFNTQSFAEMEESALVSYHFKKSTQNQRNIRVYTSKTGENSEWKRYPEVLNLSESPEKIVDLKVFAHPKKGHWRLAVLTAWNIWFYKTNDLLNWELTGSLNDRITTTHSWLDIELKQLKIENSESKKWVLFLSSKKGSPNQNGGASYYVGNFQDGVFEPEDENSGWMDYGSDQTAPVMAKGIVEDKKVMFSFGTITNTSRLESDSIQGDNTLIFPRELSLFHQYNHLFLRSRPHDLHDTLSINQKTPDPSKIEGETLFSKENDIPLKIELTFDMNNRKYLGFAEIFGIQFNNKSTAFNIGYHNDNRYFFISKSPIGDRKQRLGNDISFARYIFTGKEMNLQVIIDKHSIELFALDGAVSITKKCNLTKEIDKLRFFADQGSITLKRTKINSLKSAEHAY